MRYQRQALSSSVTPHQTSPPVPRKAVLNHLPRSLPARWVHILVLVSLFPYLGKPSRSGVVCREARSFFAVKSKQLACVALLACWPLAIICVPVAILSGTFLRAIAVLSSTLPACCVRCVFWPFFVLPVLADQAIEHNGIVALPAQSELQLTHCQYLVVRLWFAYANNV